ANLSSDKREPNMTDTPEYTPPEVWVWEKGDSPSWRYSNTNRPKLSEIGLGLEDALREGSFQPEACFRRVALARNAAREIAAEHQLGMAVAQFGGGAEPTLRRRPIGWNASSTAIHGAKGKHGPAMSMGCRFLE